MGWMVRPVPANARGPDECGDSGVAPPILRVFGGGLERLARRPRGADVRLGPAALGEYAADGRDDDNDNAMWR